MAKITINTKKQLRANKNEIAKQSMVNIVKVVVNKKVAWEVTATPRNLLNIEIKEGFVTNGVAEFVIDNFTDDVISVEFRAGGRNKQEILEKSKLFYATAIKIEGKNSDIISIRKINDKTHGYSLVTKKGGIVDIEDLIKKGYRLYVAGAYSASEARKNSTTLYKTSSSQKFQKVLNELTSGAYEILKGKEITLEESQKIGSRMGQWKTGMSHTEECGLVAAFYVGKWNVEGVEHADGKAFARDVKVASVLSNDKYEVTRNAVEGILIQNRPFTVCKTEAKVTNANYIKNKVLFDAGGHGNVVWINREEVTPEIQNEFNKLFNKGKKSEFEGKVIIIKPSHVEADLRNIDYYTDMNGLKAAYDLRRDSGFNILAIDKPLKGNRTNTNMQQLETFAAINPEATKQLMKEIASAYNKNAVHSVLRQKPSVPTLKEMEQMYTTGIIKAIAPTFALQNKKIFGTIADQATKAMVKAVNGLNYEIPGQSRILQMDFAGDFGTRVLPVGTCFAPGIKDRVIVATRSPKQYTGEFLSLINLTQKEVMDHIGNNKTLTPAQKKAIKREFRLLSESCIVIAAYEEYKEATGGADVDGDTLTIVTYRKFAQIIKKAKDSGVYSTAIKVESEKVHQEKDMVFNLSTLHTAFVKLISNGNLSIGEVTYMNNFMLGCLFDLLNGKDDAAKEFFKYAGNDGNGDGEYTKLPRKYNKKLKMDTVVVSFGLLERMVEEIKSMKLSMDNMIAALDDLNAAFMMLQMETIDAAKKGTRVPVPYVGMLNVFTQASKTPIAIELGIRAKEGDEAKLFKKTDDGVYYRLEQRSGWVQEGINRNGEPIMKYIHQDLFQEIRVDIAREVMKMARSLMRRYNNAKYNDDISTIFIAAKDQAERETVRDLIELKKIYNTINAGVIENEEEEPFYKTYIAALANTTRLVTQNLTDIERATLAEAISMPSSDISSHSSFALNTLKEEFIKMATEYFAEIDVAGEKLEFHKNIKEGDVLNFELGIFKDEENEKFAATKADINGEFTIKEINGRLYATKNIVDLIPEVELTNDIVFRMDFDAHSKEVRKALLEAETVEFKIVFGKGNLVFADGKQIGKFITVSGMTELNALYDGAVGKVKNVMVVEETTNDGTTKNMLVGIMELDNNSTPDLEGEEMEFFEL